MEEIIKDIFIKFQDDDNNLEFSSEEHHKVKKCIICKRLNCKIVHKKKKIALKEDKKSEPEEFMKNIFIKFHKFSKQDNKSEEYMEHLFIKFHDFEIDINNSQLIREKITHHQNEIQKDEPEKINENIFIKFHEDTKTFAQNFKKKYETSLKKAYQNYFKYIDEVVNVNNAEPNTEKGLYDSENSKTIIKNKRKCIDWDENIRRKSLKIEKDDDNETNLCNCLKELKITSNLKETMSKTEEKLIVEDILTETLNSIDLGN